MLGSPVIWYYAWQLSAIGSCLKFRFLDWELCLIKLMINLCFRNGSICMDSSPEMNSDRLVVSHVDLWLSYYSLLWLIMLQAGRMLLLLVPLLTIVPTCSPALQQDLKASDKQNSRVLLVAPPAMGHIIPLLRLGEELVKRGHTVGFCTTKISGVNITEESCNQYGLIYLNAGLDPYTWYVE